MSDSLRTISEIQFADGTTIDGDRLDMFLDDFVARINNIQSKDLYRRLTQTQFVGGWSNSTVATSGQLPWMRIINDDTDLIGVTPGDGYTNPLRLKGTSQIASQIDNQYACSNTLYFRKPVILHSIHVSLHQKAALNDEGDIYDSEVPVDGSSNGDYFNDFYLDVSIDNPYLTENRAMADVEIQRVRFRLDGDLFSFRGIANLNAAYNDMTPARTVRMEGVHIDLRNLDIPIHRDSRLRYSLVIPHYTADEVWGASPWTYHDYSWSITVLEGLE